MQHPKSRKLQARKRVLPSDIELRIAMLKRLWIRIIIWFSACTMTISALKSETEIFEDNRTINRVPLNFANGKIYHNYTFESPMPSEKQCETGLCNIRAKFRDFRPGRHKLTIHPDFKNYVEFYDSNIMSKDAWSYLYNGFPRLYFGDRDRSRFFESPKHFALWYGSSTDPQIYTQSYVFNMCFKKGTEFTYSSSRFFPLDDYDLYSRNFFAYDGRYHNFAFTTFIEMTFTYTEDIGNDSFLQIAGRDDIFVFINSILVIDRGALPTPRDISIPIKEIAKKCRLRLGRKYKISVFHAQRTILFAPQLYISVNFPILCYEPENCKEGEYFDEMEVECLACKSCGQGMRIVSGTGCTGFGIEDSVECEITPPIEDGNCGVCHSLVERCVTIENPEIDVYFVASTLSRVEELDWKMIVECITIVIKDFEFGTDNVRAAFIRYGENVVDQIRIDEACTPECIQQERCFCSTSEYVLLRTLGYYFKISPFAKIVPALERIRASILKQKLLRPNAKHVVFLFVNGIHDPEYELEGLAEAMREEGIILFAMGAGSYDRDDLVDVVGQEHVKDHILTLSNLDNFSEFFKRVTSDIKCDTQNGIYEEWILKKKEYFLMTPKCGETPYIVLDYKYHIYTEDCETNSNWTNYNTSGCQVIEYGKLRNCPKELGECARCVPGEGEDIGNWKEVVYKNIYAERCKEYDMIHIQNEFLITSPNCQTIDLATQFPEYNDDGCTREEKGKRNECPDLEEYAPELKERIRLGTIITIGVSASVSSALLGASLGAIGLHYHLRKKRANGEPREFVSSEQVNTPK